MISPEHLTQHHPHIPTDASRTPAIRQPTPGEQLAERHHSETFYPQAVANDHTHRAELTISRAL